MPVGTMIRPIDAVDGRQNAEKLKSFSEGKTIGAEVLSSKNGEVTLKTVDGITVSAKLTDGGQLSNGDSVVLNVTQNANAPVSLRLISINGQDVTPTATSIMNLVLPETQAGSTVAAMLAQSMSAMGLPVTANALNAAQAALSRYPALDVDLAAFMAAQDIPINEQNIQTVSAWMTQNPKAAQVLVQFANAQAQEGAAQTQGSAHTAQGAQAAVLTQAAVRVDPDGKNPNNAQGAAASSQTPLPEGFSPKAEVLSFVSALPKALGESIKASPEAQKVLEQAFVDAATGKEPDKAAVTAEIAKLPGAQQSKAYTAFALDRALTGTAEKYAQAFKSGKLDAGTVFAALKGANADPAELKRAVNTLPEFLTKLVRQAAEHDGAARAAAPAAEQLLAQTKLGGDMSQMIYAQAPFKYENRENSAELYVMKRNSGKNAIDPQNATVLVSLQTQNIGTVDSIIHIDRGFMNIELRVDDEKIKRRVTGELETLRELIEGTQYVLHNVAVNVSKEKLTPANAAALARSGAALPSAGVDILA